MFIFAPKHQLLVSFQPWSWCMCVQYGCLENTSRECHWHPQWGCLRDQGRQTIAGPLGCIMVSSTSFSAWLTSITQARYHSSKYLAVQNPLMESKGIEVACVDADIFSVRLSFDKENGFTSRVPWSVGIKAWSFCVPWIVQASSSAATRPSPALYTLLSWHMKMSSCERLSASGQTGHRHWEFEVHFQSFVGRS